MMNTKSNLKIESKEKVWWENKQKNSEIQDNIEALSNEDNF